jgi:hypothetical protein
MRIAALRACPIRRWLIHRCGPPTSAQGLGSAPPTFAPRPGSPRSHLRRDHRPHVSAPGLGAAALGEWRHAFSPSSEVDVAAALSPSGHLAKAKGGGRAAARWPLGADVAGVSPVPAQMWQGRAQVLVHWQFRCRCGTAQFRCRCGQRMWAAVYQPGPGADLAGGEPSPGADVAQPRPALALPPKSMRTRGCGPAAASGGAGIGARARPLLRLPTLVGRSGSS